MVVHASNLGTREAETARTTWQCSVSEAKEKKTRKKQAIAETYLKNSIEELKVDIINVDSTIYTFLFLFATPNLTD